MNYLRALVGSGVLVSMVVIAGALPAAAQPTALCPLISDDTLSQIVGFPLQATNAQPASPAGAAAGGPVFTQLCYAKMADNNTLVMTHMVAPVAPGPNQMLALALGAMDIGSGAVIDPSQATTTSISGLGDVAYLIIDTSSDRPSADLIAWRGGEGFGLSAEGLADPQTTLPALAQAIMANEAPQP
jgi:hypothetical protein